MENIIYSKYSNDRIDKFAIRTDMIKSGQDIFVRKRALTEDAKEHVRNMYQIYLGLRKLYSLDTFYIPVCTQLDDHVDMEYVAGKPFDSILDGLLESGHVNELKETAMQMFSQMEKVRKKIPFEITPEFERIFGYVNLPKELAAADLLDIDMIFSNIIIDDRGRKSVIDYEWTFFCPIPFKFLFYRCIHCYIDANFKRQNQNIEELYWKAGITEREMREFEKMELHFQNQIYTKESSLNALWMKMHGKVYEINESTIAEGRSCKQKLEKDLQSLETIVNEQRTQIDDLKLSLERCESEKEKKMEDINYLLRKQDFIFFDTQAKIKEKNEEQIQRRNQYNEHANIELNRTIWKRLKKSYDNRKKKYAIVEGSNRLAAGRTEFMSLSPCMQLQGNMAVHICVSKIESIEQLFQYLKNIPYHYDLFVSGSKDIEKDFIRAMVSKTLPFVKEVIICQNDNDPSNIIPMVELFSGNYTRYRYLLHLHDSLPFLSELENQEWYRHTIASLLGDTETVRRIVTLMEKENIGLVYPDAFEGCTFYDCSWLPDPNYGKELLLQFGIQDSHQIIQYPIGGMFWVRVEAIKTIFDHDYTIDLPQTPDSKKRLELLLEKLVSRVSTYNGYVGALLDLGNNTVFHRVSRRGFREYENMTYESTERLLMDYTNISFDLMGTLITGKLYNEQAIYLYMMKNNETLPKDFFSKRIEIGRQKSSVDDIYRDLAREYNWSETKMTEYKDLEISVFLEYSCKRDDVVALMQSLKKQGKKIFILAETIYSRDHIMELLQKEHISEPDALYLSSELQEKVGDGKEPLYRKMFETVEIKKTVHVGDDLYEDWQKPRNLGCASLWIMRPADAYWLSDEFSLKDQKISSLQKEVQLGEKINIKQFNSPFLCW